MTPIDVRKLLGRSGRFRKGPGDIRKWVGATSNMSDQFSKNKKRRGSSHKSLSGLSPKLVELGVSQRLIKLDNLTSKSDKELTNAEKYEKEDLLRLEKKRKAAVVCRGRKKRYVQSLEERSVSMSKHVQALEKQNKELRAMLRVGRRGVTLPPPLPPYKATPLADKPRCYNRRKEKVQKRSVLATMEKLYLSALYVAPQSLGTIGTLDLPPPMCVTNGSRRSKRLRLM